MDDPGIIRADYSILGQGVGSGCRVINGWSRYAIVVAMHPQILSQDCRQSVESSMDGPGIGGTWML